MALRFAMSGGNFIFSIGQAVSGIWALTGGSGIVSTAPLGRGDTYAFTGSQYRTPNLGGNYAGLVAGMAWYNNGTGVVGGNILIIFRDNGGIEQCSLRQNASGQLFFSRNGVTIGGPSTFALIPNGWAYIEFKALFSTTGTGTCEVRVNSVTVLTATGVTNAATAASAAVAEFQNNSGAGTNPYLRDFYVVDTVAGANVNYLGDVNIVELFPNGPGVNSAWAANVGPFTLTSVNATGVYQGTITGGAGNAYVGYNFNITGFVNGANNPSGAICTASTATSITFGALTTVVETHAGSAAFQAIVQPGINQTGTRPNGDVTYLSDSTAGDKFDFAHTPLTLSGIILGVVHQTYARKDDLGARAIAQICISTGTTEQGATISLGNTFQYWPDILEVDPHTSAQFTVSGLNSSTFGNVEIT